jgi:phosphoribosylglycinamide formyltransferase-1
MSNIAIFASGSGTNAQAIVEYFKEKEFHKVKLILSNKPDAYVLERAKVLNVPTVIFNKSRLYQTLEIEQILKNEKIDLIVLAGFLWLIPGNILKEYNKKIINIHPALLPKYGGQGMYGMRVHEAVVANHENETGITIHYVNEIYDQGEIIFQAVCKVEPSDTAEKVAQKVHELEYTFFPKTIENVLNSLDK